MTSLNLATPEIAPLNTFVFTSSYAKMTAASKLVTFWNDLKNFVYGHNMVVQHIESVRSAMAEYGADSFTHQFDELKFATSHLSTAYNSLGDQFEQLAAAYNNGQLSQADWEVINHVADVVEEAVEGGKAIVVSW
jgi:hypothetical protein